VGSTIWFARISEIKRDKSLQTQNILFIRKNAKSEGISLPAGNVRATMLQLSD
jgi:hypothetical protein